MRRALTVGCLLLAAGCVASRPPEKPQYPGSKVQQACGLTDAPVTRDQALCLGRNAGIDSQDGAYTLEAGTDLERQPIWILRQDCERVSECVELWIRQSDGAIVNTRNTHAFEGYESLPRQR